MTYIINGLARTRPKVHCSKSPNNEPNFKRIIPLDRELKTASTCKFSRQTDKNKVGNNKGIHYKWSS